MSAKGQMMLSLSICIPTLNRVKFIEETLDSIVSQYDGSFEIVVVDGGSVDGTIDVLRNYSEKYDFFRYFCSPAEQPKAPSNQGFDRDCDLAVRLSQGQYCWLMTDDDTLVSDAIFQVQPHLNQGHDAVVVSITVKNFHLNRVLYEKRPAIATDRFFSAEKSSDFFVESAIALTYVGCLIVRRDIWISRERADYFGTGFVHMGVMFQRRLVKSAVVLARPLVNIRYGNSLWTTRAFQILMIDFPSLIWSFAWLEVASKQKIVTRRPWLSVAQLIKLHALGAYDAATYDRYLSNEKMSLGNRFSAKLVSLLPRFFTWMVAMFVSIPYGYIKRNHLHTYDLLYSFRQPKR
jgi:abequosyltransferase